MKRMVQIPLEYLLITNESYLLSYYYFVGFSIELLLKLTVFILLISIQLAPYFSIVV